MNIILAVSNIVQFLVGAIEDFWATISTGYLGESQLISIFSSDTKFEATKVVHTGIHICNCLCISGSHWRSGPCCPIGQTHGCSHNRQPTCGWTPDPDAYGKCRPLWVRAPYVLHIGLIQRRVDTHTTRLEVVWAVVCTTLELSAAIFAADLGESKLM